MTPVLLQSVRKQDKPRFFFKTTFVFFMPDCFLNPTPRNNLMLWEPKSRGQAQPDQVRFVFLWGT